MVVAEGMAPVSTNRPGGGIWQQLLHPHERPLPASSPLASIHVRYPSRSTPVFGLDVHWLISFFVLSIVFALLLKPVLRVQV